MRKTAITDRVVKDGMRNGKEGFSKLYNVPTYQHPLNENVYPHNFLEYDVPARSKGTLHPTQKPVSLYRYLIRTYTNEGETVLDIAMGSGTTIEAAEIEGRNSIGIEKEIGYFQIAEKRAKSAVLQQRLFTPSNYRLHLTGGSVPAQGDLFTPEDLPSEGKLPAPTPRR
jgi:DNA modification methylase